MCSPRQGVTLQEVAQFGQSTWFGTKGSQVQILPS